MSKEFYLTRRLVNPKGDLTVNESDLNQLGEIIIILGEPGIGKTSLLENLANKFQTTCKSANVINYKNSSLDNTYDKILIIDAFDELVKIDSSSVMNLLGKISSSPFKKIFISSRSSEWLDSYNRKIEQFFGKSPIVLYLQPFDIDDQRSFFNFHFVDEDFEKFYYQISKFDLQPLLSTPQMLKMLGMAYIQKNREFLDKKSIFPAAFIAAATDTNKELSIPRYLTTQQKVAIAQQVFANLLLSGSEGVSNTEINSERLFPFLNAIVVNEHVKEILASQLFRPSDKSDHHQPVHKILAEYGAAEYLSHRLKDSVNPLSINQLLAIIAPNGFVRDELRGMVGWLATVGNKSIQERLIELDPYAIIANGDPSQLLNSSKKLIFKNLKDLSISDPYFRRGDFFRSSFSTVGFFTFDIIDEVKVELLENKNNYFRKLLLGMLESSNEAIHFKNELEGLVLDAHEDSNVRFEANACIANMKDYSVIETLNSLMIELSTTSLHMITYTLTRKGIEKFDDQFLEKLFFCFIQLYTPNNFVNTKFTRIIGERYFVNEFIKQLPIYKVIYLLDQLTNKLLCTKSTESILNESLYAQSKVIGYSLDQYFTVNNGLFDAEKIWYWIRNLRFENSILIESSASVKFLKNNNQLRQQVFKIAFNRITDPDHIHDLWISNFSVKGHSGLTITYEDWQFFTDYAYESDNHNLWRRLIPYHSRFDSENHKRRHYMRQQAKNKSNFMLAWSAFHFRPNRVSEYYKYEKKHKRYEKRCKNWQEIVFQRNRRYINENRQIIENGEQLNCLKKFANLVLHHPSEISTQIGDENLVRNSLYNALSTIDGLLNDDGKFKPLDKNENYHSLVEIITACIHERFRKNGDLNNISRKLLINYRLNTHFSYSGINFLEKKSIIEEVDKILFKDTESAEIFIREVVEFELESRSEYSRVEWLEIYEVFQSFIPKLPLEWLKKFPETNIRSLSELFNKAYHESTIQELSGFVKEYTDNLLLKYPKETEDTGFEKRRVFWLIRAFYLIEDNDVYWDWLKEDEDNIFEFEILSDTWNRGGDGKWSALNAIRIEKILNHYLTKWEKIDLPNSWGTDSPKEERAYRFLQDLVYQIKDDKSDDSVKVIERLLLSPLFNEFYATLKSQLAEKKRFKAFENFKAPTSEAITDFFQTNTILTVEHLRALIKDEIEVYQKDLNGGDTTTKRIFYENNKHKNEVDCALIIAERLRLRLEPKSIIVTPEHQMHEARRADITFTKMDEKRQLLVMEIKGQWHPELFNAMSNQLFESYSIHPDAYEQGIYLVLWFGSSVKIANRSSKDIEMPEQLLTKLNNQLPDRLKGKVDILVLDLSIQVY